MKLAQLLIERADAQRKLGELQTRLANVAQIQEGSVPVESPDQLIILADQTFKRLQRLISTINAVNARTEAAHGMTLADAIARRDVLRQTAEFYKSVFEAATNTHIRYSSKELLMVPGVEPVTIRTKADMASFEYRHLDALIQQVNWETEVPELL